MYIHYKNAHGVVLIKAQDFIKLHVISRPGNVTFKNRLPHVSKPGSSKEKKHC